MPYEVHDLKPLEVSVVRRPAVRKTFLLLKDADGVPGKVRLGDWEYDLVGPLDADPETDNTTDEETDNVSDLRKSTSLADAVRGAFTAIEKASDGTVGAAATAEIESRALRLRQADPLLSPEIARARVIKSAGGGCLLNLATGPVSGRGFEVFEEAEQANPGWLAGVAAALGVRGLAKSAGFGDGASYISRPPTEGGGGDTDDQYPVPKKGKHESPAAFSKRYNAFRASVAARLNRGGE